jgi:hypothetical protein
MKKNLFFLAALAGLACWSCNDNEDPQLTPTIELTAPTDGAAVNLNSVPSVTFSWKAVEGIPGYRLALNTSPDMSAAQTLTANANPLVVTANDLNAKILSLSGTVENAEHTIYWSIQPISGEANTQTRSLKVTTRAGVPTIVLTAPADGVTIDVNNNFTAVAFTGQPVSQVRDYTVKFATNAGFTGGAVVTEDLGEYVEAGYSVPDADAFDLLMANLGVEINEQAVVYWTIVPTQPDDAVVTQTRTFTGIRKTAPLVTPEDGTVLALDYAKGSQEAVTFKWGPKDGTLKLVIGKSADLSGAKEIDVTGITKTYTHNELQALLIDDASLGLKRYFENTLYWTVKANGTAVAAPIQLKLTGEKIFTDVRGDESITYKVAIITYLNGDKAVWLAENLRTKRYVNGDRMSGWEGEDGGTAVVGDRPENIYMYPPPPMTGGNRTGYTGDPIPEVIRTNMGVLYNQGVSSFADAIPIGWRLPAQADFNALYGAVAAAPGSMLVLLDPNCFPDKADDPNINAWGMNMGPNGRFQWSFWGWLYSGGNDVIFNMDQTGVAGGDVACGIWGIKDPISLTNVYFSEGSTGAATRVIYTGE